MNLKHDKIRGFGQRSIPSTFVFRPSNLAKDSKDDARNKDSNKDSSLSFSDFLDQKVHRSPVPPKIVKGKSKPFRSPLGPRDDDGSIDQWVEVKKEEKGKSYAVDKVVYEQFKHTAIEKGDFIESGNDVEKRTPSTSPGIGSSYVGNIGSSSSNKDQEMRKRKNPCEDGDGKHDARKHLLVLGDDPKPKKKGKGNRSINNKRPRPLYNHYGNGCGWWDCDMEGIDTEEVGYGEIWEGVGSTTFGGIEWH